MKWLRFRLIFSTLIERIVFTTNAFLQDMEYLRQSDYNTEILRSCQCQCQSLALDNSNEVHVHVLGDYDHHLDHDEASPCVGD